MAWFRDTLVLASGVLAVLAIAIGAISLGSIAGALIREGTAAPLVRCLVGIPAGLAMMGLGFGLLWIRPRLGGATYAVRKRERRSLPAIMWPAGGGALGVTVGMAIIDADEWPMWVSACVMLGGVVAGAAVAFVRRREDNEIDLHCPNCGYDLRGTAFMEKDYVRCSECGEEWVVVAKRCDGKDEIEAE